MSASLVGSEMCIRDSSRNSAVAAAWPTTMATPTTRTTPKTTTTATMTATCLLYTSDAADDM
eukprot:15295791-Alexandrium_andersonii.AAC.1